MIVELPGLPNDLTRILEVEPGKLDIKRRQYGILFISLQVGTLFKEVIMTYLIIDYRVDSAS